MIVNVKKLLFLVEKNLYTHVIHIEDLCIDSLRIAARVVSGNFDVVTWWKIHWWKYRVNTGSSVTRLMKQKGEQPWKQ